MASVAPHDDDVIMVEARLRDAAHGCRRRFLTHQRFQREKARTLAWHAIHGKNITDDQKLEAQQEDIIRRDLIIYEIELNHHHWEPVVYGRFKDQIDAFRANFRDLVRQKGTFDGLNSRN